jgi:magnesium chelatase family protein
LSRVFGAALVGVDGVPVEVEVRISSQLPRVDVVGLAEAAVRESAARVRAAISSTGHAFPDRRVTVNLAPASVRKSGAGLDLPIAVGILAAAAAIPPESLDGVALLGELALDGRLRPVRGALALALAARDAGCKTVVVPAACASEAALAPGIEVRSAPDLAAVIAHLLGSARLPLAPAPVLAALPPPIAPDLEDVRGQERAKRALEIAAAGGHALLLQGPPGCGKTMLAQRLPGLLPPLDFDEALEATRIHGAAGRLGTGEAPAPIVCARPFRAPHHSASVAGLLGGGSPPRPGEVSLAHRGVLFLDELPEFARGALEALRQVLEERRVVVARARHSSVFPAHFQLVAAANPCPCGWRLSTERDCRCDDGAVARYRARLSGPLLDRIDLHVRTPAVPYRALESARAGPSSAEVRARVLAARARAARRLAPLGLHLDAEIPDRALDDHALLTPEARALLRRVAERLRLSARAVRRVQRVARTIADLEGEEKLGAPVLAEALSYRADDGGEGIGA